jgi:uncharacterized YigZ family protein
MRYRVPASQHETELVIDRSRFRCTLTRAATPDAAQQFVRSLQLQHPEATHHCWAFVAGPPGSTSHIGLSDDGEPHGTAGRPMLTVLLHADVGEIAAVVTRWYGGVKLGTGGLARAYGGAVQQALATLPLTWRVERVRASFAVDYAALTPVRQLLESLEAIIEEEEYSDVVAFTIALPREQADALAQGLADRTRGRSTPTFERAPDPAA